LNLALRAEEYLDRKTLSLTPRPKYHWKAEDLSFLYVLLVWGVKLASMLNKRYQSSLLCVDVKIFRGMNKLRLINLKGDKFVLAGRC
jgi:hypothetical protein